MQAIERTITPITSDSATYVAAETNAIHATPQKSPSRLLNLIKKSLRALRIPGKRDEVANENNDKTIEWQQILDRKLSFQEQYFEIEKYRLTPSSTRCTDGKSGPYDQERSRTPPAPQAADFSDLDDPFACHTLGSPRIVKDIDSALPPKSPCENKEIEARKRARQAAQRPKSAGANSPTPPPKVEWRFLTSTETAALRQVCLQSPVTPPVRSSRWKSLPPLPIGTNCQQQAAKFTGRSRLSSSASSCFSPQRLMMDMPRNSRTSIDIF